MDTTAADATPPQATIALLQGHSLSGVVQHEIERAILSGELPAGTHLNENALAAKLGVSRGPVREACRALAELGLVQLVPNRGVFISRMNQADAQEVYDLRAGLIGLAGSLLCTIATDRQITQLRLLLDEMERAAAAPDFAAYARLNLEFHDFIVRSTGNGRLTKTYRGLVKEFQLFRGRGLVESDALLVSNSEHRAIVEAIAARDARRSHEASFEHVSNGKKRMLAALALRAGDSSGSEQSVGGIDADG
jgi:DNA-binding GntR family transcriptional regulator